MKIVKHNFSCREFSKLAHIDRELLTLRTMRKIVKKRLSVNSEKLRLTLVELEVRIGQLNIT